MALEYKLRYAVEEACLFAGAKDSLGSASVLSLEQRWNDVFSSRMGPAFRSEDSVPDLPRLGWRMR